MRAKFEPIRTPNMQSVVIHPDQSRFELIRDFRWRIGGRNDIAARAVHFVRKADRNRLTGYGFIQVAVECDNLAGQSRSCPMAGPGSHPPA